MFLKKRQNSSVERAAMALAAACGVAHAAFFALFAWRVIGRDGFGVVGWAILAFFALAGLGLNILGYWLIKRGEGPLRRWGFMAVAASTALAGVLLGIASWTA
jgi:cytochrome bd-type quinol oxidase subunit 2